MSWIILNHINSTWYEASDLKDAIKIFSLKNFLSDAFNNFAAFTFIEIAL